MTRKKQAAAPESREAESGVTRKRGRRKAERPAGRARGPDHGGAGSRIAGADRRDSGEGRDGPGVASGPGRGPGGGERGPGSGTGGARHGRGDRYGCGRDRGERGGYDGAGPPAEEGGAPGPAGPRTGGA